MPNAWVPLELLCAPKGLDSSNSTTLPSTSHTAHLKGSTKLRPIATAALGEHLIVLVSSNSERALNTLTISAASLIRSLSISRPQPLCADTENKLSKRRQLNGTVLFLKSQLISQLQLTSVDCPS